MANQTRAEDVAAATFSAMNEDQLKRYVEEYEDDPILIVANGIRIMDLPQLIQLGAMVAVEHIRRREISMTIKDEKIEEGILDYDLHGTTDFLDIIADEMAKRGQLEFEQDPAFHKVSAIITGAQIVANQIDPDNSKPILEKGEKLASFEPGTRERAEKTKDFLDDLFEFLKDKLPN
jgi:hypothetical protein